MQPFPPPAAPARPAPTLRTLQTVCAALALSVLILALVGRVVQSVREEPAPGLPPAVVLSLTSVGIVLILLASRIRSGLLRRAVLPLAPMAATSSPDDEARVFAAYLQATLVSFALLEGTAIVGFVLELMTATARYGLVLYAASLISMLVRWPRQAEVARLARRRTEPG